jgi:hypothetical protein
MSLRFAMKVSVKLCGGGRSSSFRRMIQHQLDVDLNIEDVMRGVGLPNVEEENMDKRSNRPRVGRDRHIR